ncbi:MAG: DNA topoisomerase VI subunit B, partial [Nanoarchaeota archaeon]|nr:DNA topoisomerase VI subunit B [Nanoarchaeota archaeon]
SDKQRAISISEFFTKNRHLLGFDNPRKALLTTVKEAVDNSLDACEEMKILPEIKVFIDPTTGDRFKITVEDNGPGIVKKQIPKIFAKLLYGSKFHRLKMSRGQQGIGISAAALYGQLTTGKPIRIISKIGPTAQAHYYELHLNTSTNEPEIIKEEIREWEGKDHGTKLQLELEGKYHKGKLSVDEFLQFTAISNPHATLIYRAPEQEAVEYPRGSNISPKEAKEIKPHPKGIELGMLIKMLKDTSQKTLQSFLRHDFSRVSSKLAKEICGKAGLYEKARPSRIARQEADNLYKVIQETKIMNPPTDCISPITEDQMLKGLKKEIDAEFYAAVTRPPSVYRGNPFQIEVAIGYGGNIPNDGLAKVIRYANRVPLQHQAGGCAITKSVVQTAWRNYAIQQSRGALPSGPLIIMIHMASVWVPFTSESKEAIALYPEIIKEIKLALQEAGRKLASYVRKKKKVAEEGKKKSYIEKYLPHLGIGVKDILGLDEKEEKAMLELLKEILEKSRK